MLSRALQVEFAVLRKSLRYPKGPQRSSADCSRGPARSLEVGAVAPACHDIPAKKIRLSGIVRTMGAALAMAYGWPGPATAEKIEAALARAYQNNPQLNAQRATVRQTDEGVAQALSGYRPTVSADATAGKGFLDAQASIQPTCFRRRSTFRLILGRHWILGRSVSTRRKTCSTPGPRTGRGRPKPRSSQRVRLCG